MQSATIHPKPQMNSYVRPMRIFKENDRTNQSNGRLVYTGDMTYVAPVFTEYEQQVIRELAVHRVQPNAVHRLLEGAGRPVARLLRIGRDSNNRAVRGLTAHVRGWIEEGLIKTFRAGNKLANTKDISRRFEKRGINIGTDFASLRYVPLSQLDAV